MIKLIKKIVLICSFVAVLAGLVILLVPGEENPKARITPPKYFCIQNLREIDAAKAEWSLEHKKAQSDIPSWDDLKPYLWRQRILKCPLNGVYTIGCVSNLPTCSIAGHVLP